MATRKTALVLSAGGMFGAYQAGVWSELEKVFHPDLVVGASIGSLNGWCIAGGISGAEMEQRWLNLEDAAKHEFQIPGSLADGFVRGERVERWIREIFQTYQPQCEFATVATEVSSMKPRLFCWPGLEWTHLAASCAVPFFLQQQRIGGLLYADGGLIDPLPLWAALELGAERIVAVNLLVNRPFVIRTAARIAGMCGSYQAPDTHAIELVTIEPSARLGTPRDAMYWDREKAQSMIALGRLDTRAALRNGLWGESLRAA